MHPTQRLEQCAVVWLPCNTKSIPVIMFSHREQMISMQTQHFRCVFDWETFSGSLTPPHPTSWWLQISFTLWERTTCVYFSVLIRQWSSLRPACPLLLDKDTSKASVFVVGAPQEDEAMDLLPGQGYRSRCSFQSIISAKNTFSTRLTNFP